MMHYMGAIFDLDGTLLNTLEDLSDSVNQVLKQYGHPVHTCEDYKLKIGRGFRNLLEVSFPAGSWDAGLIDGALAMFLRIYDEKYMDKTAPYDGILRMLGELDAKGIKLAVNSNKRTDYTNNLIKKHFPGIPFVDVIGERKGIPKKPDPYSALEIARKMKLSPHEILYAGDSGADMLTGTNAGMDTIGVLWGFRERKELIDSGATYIVSRADEIIKLF
ncbi:MAG TPA: HAD family hydrolase [Clostridiales bacterium]|nr:HAD family hydrolase [Clostridiales bacterium]